MKKHMIQIVRLAFQIVFFAGLTTSLIPGFMNIWPTTLMIAFFLCAIAGNFYCGWLCPFGSLQEWLGKLGSRLFEKKFRMPQKFQRLLQYSKYLLYAAILINVSLSVISGFSQTSAFNGNFYFWGITGAGSLAQLQQIASVPVIACLAAYLIAAMFFDRPFCNYFCPDGIKYSLLSFLRVFTIKRNAAKCVNCKKCSLACPMQIDVASANHLRNANCINCMQCITACPVKQALQYGLCIPGMSNGEITPKPRFNKEASSCQ